MFNRLQVFVPIAILLPQLFRFQRQYRDAHVRIDGSDATEGFDFATGGIVGIDDFGQDE